MVRSSAGVGKLMGSIVATLATIYCAGLSGVSASRIFVTTDMRPSFYLLGSGVLALMSLLAAVACVAAARPARTTGRLAIVSLTTWLLPAIATAINNIEIPFGGFVGLMGIAGVVSVVASSRDCNRSSTAMRDK